MSTVAKFSDVAASNRAQIAEYSSMADSTFDDKLALLKVVNNAKPVAENLGKPMMLRHVLIQSVELTEESTGELNNVPRVTLIDESGDAFVATSTGVYMAVRNLLQILGEPAKWPGAVAVEVIEVKQKGNRNYFTLNILG